MEYESPRLLTPYFVLQTPLSNLPRHRHWREHVANPDTGKDLLGELSAAGSDRINCGGRDPSSIFGETSYEYQ